MVNKIQNLPVLSWFFHYKLLTKSMVRWTI